MSVRSITWLSVCVAMIPLGLLARKLTDSVDIGNGVAFGCFVLAFLFFLRDQRQNL
jgi:hypothetical protein